MQGLRKKFQDELAAASTTAEESIGNIRTVRSFSQERKAMSNYKADIDKSYNVGAKLALASGTLIVTPYNRASFLGGGGEGVLCKVYMGRFCPDFIPLPFYLSF